MKAQDDQLARLGEGVDRIRGLGQNMQEETKTQLVRDPPRPRARRTPSRRAAAARRAERPPLPPARALFGARRAPRTRRPHRPRRSPSARGAHRAAS